MSCAGHHPLHGMLSASATTLRADADYIRLLEAESTWPALYRFARPNAVQARTHPIQGLHWLGVPACGVDVYSRLLPRHFRVHTRAAQNRPQTELYGTAPYVALGRGGLMHVDTETRLQHGDWVQGKGSRSVSELDFDRFDFVTLPGELKKLNPEMRYGQITRVGPSYMQPRD